MKYNFDEGLRCERQKKHSFSVCVTYSFQSPGCSSVHPEGTSSSPSCKQLWWLFYGEKTQTEQVIRWCHKGTNRSFYELSSHTNEGKGKRLSSHKNENSVFFFFYSPFCRWKVAYSFVVHRRFLEHHSKTALQHSPKKNWRRRGTTSSACDAVLLWSSRND